jgi:hypothetical protein
MYHVLFGGLLITFSLQPPTYRISFFFQTWLRNVDSMLRPQIWVGASPFFFVYKIDHIIFNKKYFTLIYKLFLGRSTRPGRSGLLQKEADQPNLKKSMPSDGDCSNEDFRQESMIAF